MRRAALTRRALLLGALGASSLAACGGNKQAAESPGPQVAVEDQAEASDDRDPYCADGTCFTCGEAFCPLGWYCDDGAKGGSACSWVPECADEASCACVEAVLGTGCKCQEREGGVHVDCS